jgi:hypothetical protein
MILMNRLNPQRVNFNGNPMDTLEEWEVLWESLLWDHKATVEWENLEC